MPAEQGPLRRGAPTWLGYSLVGLFAYLLYALGAATPYLRTEFGLSDSVAGIHASAFALGTAASGAVGERAVRRLGRDRCLWLSAVGAALGGGGLALLHHPVGTLAAAFAMGAAGSLLLALVNAALAEAHPRWSARVLTEAQVAASICSLSTAVLIGLAASSQLGWRVAMLPPVVCVAGLLLLGRARRITLGSEPARSSYAWVDPAEPARAPELESLPRRFWARWTVVVLVIGVEFSVVFWGPEILRVHAGLGAGEASASMGLFIVGMLLGRVLGARFVAGGAYSGQLLPVGLILVGGGAMIAWVSPIALMDQLALGVIGLGVSNLYPQAVDAAIKSANGSDVIAAARCSLAFGVALLCAPLLLGAAADAFGVVNGLWLLVAMSALALILDAVTSSTSRSGRALSVGF